MGMGLPSAPSGGEFEPRDAAEHSPAPPGAAGDRFVLFSQPIVHLASGLPSHHELLLRIERADGSHLVPESFASTVREQGLEPELDRWVAEQAVAMLQPATARSGPQLEINISRRSAIGPELPAMLNSMLAERGIGPDALIVEVEQGESVEPGEMRHFADRAFRLACDFGAEGPAGAGLDDLQRLAELPFDYVKIVGELVGGLRKNPVDQAMVARAARVARSYGRRTVAMHVEDEETLQILREGGVDYGQGYLFSRPEPLQPG